MTLPRLFLLVLAALLAPAAHGELPPTIAEALRAAGLAPDSMAFVVQRASDGRTIAAHQAERPMQPASTLKVLTSIVALDTLGPAFRGRTDLLAAGPVSGGVLRGDLVLRGAADVDLDAQAFEQMLRVARLKGVREVRGDLLLDRTFFDPARTDAGLPPFDEAPEFRYNVIPDALLLNTNLIGIDLSSDARTVRAVASTPLQAVIVVPRFTLVDGDCDDWDEGWVLPEVRRERSGVIKVLLSGTFPRDCDVSTAINVIDRVEFAERLFRETWKRLGGEFRGRARDAATPSGARPLARHRSRPLAEVVRDIDKRSDNPIARVVYLTLGTSRAAAGPPPTAERAERVVRDWMASKGIDADGLVLENGSGLSRTERIRPAQLAAVLRAALASPWAPELVASLPIVAVDGGMRSRLKDSPAARRARLKTGTLRDTSALAGYLKDANGVDYVIAAMINDDAADRKIARPILDALVEWLFATGFAGSPP